MSNEKSTQSSLDSAQQIALNTLLTMPTDLSPEQRIRMAIRELTTAQLLLEQAEEMIRNGSRKALVVSSVTLSPATLALLQ